MAKTLSEASSRLWLSDSDPGVSESNVEIGNFYRNTVTNDLFQCQSDILGNQVWEKHPSLSNILSFTPVIAGTVTPGSAVYTAQNGKYSKIGNLVFAWIKLAWSSTNGSGNTLITGLPFTVNATIPSVAQFKFENITLPLGGLSLSGIPTGTQIAISTNLAGSLSLPLVLPNAGVLYTHFFYPI